MSTDCAGVAFLSQTSLHTGDMMLVGARDVGVAAFSRMVREGVVIPLSAAIGHAVDVRGSSGLRALSLAPSVPQRATLTGLGALWVHGWQAGGPSPAAIEVAVPRGCHPDAPPRADASRWTFVTDQLACRTAMRIGGIAVAQPEHAVSAALARGPLSRAVEATWWALAVGLVDVSAVSAAIHPQGRARVPARAASAWDAICAASGAR